MCIRCVEAARRYFPDCPEDKIGALLVGGTCFPCGSVEQVEQNLADAKKAGCKTWEEVLGYADQEMLKAMEEAQDVR